MEILLAIPVLVIFVKWLSVILVWPSRSEEAFQLREDKLIQKLSARRPRV